MRRPPMTALLGTAAALCLGTAWAQPAPPAQPDPGAVIATVAALSEGDTGAALDAFPDGFEPAMHYRPVTEDGILVDPLGGCSSPVPLPDFFEMPCREHDLGYDLLRYARSSGHEPGPQARRGLDARLSRQLHEACRATVPGDDWCGVTATVASFAVRVNSWRQGDGAPVPESPLPYAAAVWALVAAARWTPR
ncbi:hypothetical protein [Rhodococcus sp. A5(2022)]|uniref:hypothetical protein n=1 Tax=Rhodococcus sp. A5(2022) TaxID=3003588 RepID=UPI0022A81477|nr:hypothetical protein [Rhodococcus sp. A5(2022)]MCZ1072178.1 hypothetical protein [Rhodococcus sp. A5(2022)]